MDAWICVWLILCEYGEVFGLVGNVLRLTYALKVFGLSLDLLGHLVMVYFERLRSIYDHNANL